MENAQRCRYLSVSLPLSRSACFNLNVYWIVSIERTQTFHTGRLYNIIIRLIYSECIISLRAARRISKYPVSGPRRRLPYSKEIMQFRVSLEKKLSTTMTIDPALYCKTRRLSITERTRTK